MPLTFKQKMRFYSPWIYSLHSGGCNGCDIELAAIFSPRFDIERLGVKLVGSPRSADILVVTGPVTKQIAPFLRRVYEQTPDPKVVVAIGSCAISGGVFNRDDGLPSYAILGGAHKVVRVHVCVPGCPPKPESIIQGVIMAIRELGKAK